MTEDFFFRCNNYDLLIEKLLNNLANFIKYNPDDLNRKILEKVIKRSISEIINCSIEEIDKSFGLYAKIRMYFDSNKGVFLRTDKLKMFLPHNQIGKINEGEAENCYLKAYFAKLYEKLSLKEKYKDFITQNSTQGLKAILDECSSYGSYAAFYKISKGKTPTKEELEDFIKTQ